MYTEIHQSKKSPFFDCHFDMVDIQMEQHLWQNSIYVNVIFPLQSVSTIDFRKNGLSNFFKCFFSVKIDK